MPAFFIEIERAKGRNSLDYIMRRLGDNFSTKEMAKAVRKSWKHIKEPMSSAFKDIPIPKKKGKYKPSHPNVIKYRRKPGQLEGSLRYRVTLVKTGQVPRAYMSITGYPWNFLVSGTVERLRPKRKLARTGAIPDRVREETFYQSTGPRIFDRALDYLVKQPNIAQPFR